MPAAGVWVPITRDVGPSERRYAGPAYGYAESLVAPVVLALTTAFLILSHPWRLRLRRGQGLAIITACPCLITLVLWAIATAAAEFGCSDPGQALSCKIYVHRDPDGPVLKTIDIWMRGEIVKGDFEKYARLLAASGPYVQTLTVNSQGGDVLEAIKIGRLTKRLLIEVVVDEKCWSACVFIFAGSRQPFPFMVGGGEKLVGGLKRMPPPEIGVHIPTFDDVYFSGLNLEETQNLYDRLFADVAAYLREMRTPERVISLMWATPSNKLAFVRLTWDRQYEGIVDQEDVLHVVWPEDSAANEWLRRKCPPSPGPPSEASAQRAMTCEYSAYQEERRRVWHTVKELR